MRLEEVLPALRAGKRIRHESWRQKLSARLDDHGRACIFENDENLIPFNIVENNVELLDDRWEVVEA